MSKFEIYASKGISLNKLQSINKSIYVLFCVVFPFLALAGLIIWMAVIVFLVVLARRINKTMVKHGELQLGVNGIVKNIGDLIQLYPYDEIQEIKVRKHLRNIFYMNNNDGSKTYLIAFKTVNNKIERFVVSSQSIDKPENEVNV